MLLTAKDLRMFSRGRQSYERILMNALDDINFATRNAALLEKYTMKITLQFEDEFFDQARKDIIARLSSAGLSADVSHRVGIGVKFLDLTITW